MKLNKYFHFAGRAFAPFILSSVIFCALAGSAADGGDSPRATAVDQIKVAKDFKVELLYNVPKDKDGSWVNLCMDPKGRLITSDQYGFLYRITPSPVGGLASDTKVEKIDLEIGHAQGLLYAFDSLYVMVADDAYQGRGLYRVRDTDGDDRFDKVEFLRKLEGGGEHGPHAILLSPDGKSLTVIIGNQTKLTELAGSRVPPIWSEDHLLPRMADGRGFMKGVLGPGGKIYKVSPDGKDWELYSVGFRNEFDGAYNRQGELFTYDADMEWDMNTPWYRPTRVCLVTSGSEFGWRNGTGKWPPYYADTLPAVLNIGPGSPTGVAFGYGAKFPAKYQDALFICDWSYGKLYAVHLTPDGSSYKAEKEEFIAASPLPLTDIVVNPKDGAVYFTIGGRKTQSGLYRVTYTGKESTAPSKGDSKGAAARAIRHKLEAFHGRKDIDAIKTAWPYLGDKDRFIRTAARVAIESQAPILWQERALNEKNPQASITALAALSRASVRDEFHRQPADPQPDPMLQSRVLDALGRIEWNKLTDPQRLELIRAHALAFIRLGPPDAATAQRVAAKFDPHYPATSREMNAELCNLLVYLQAPSAAAKTMALLAQAPTQEEQLEYAKALRMLKTGWTPAQRKDYFSWFLKAASYRGGASFGAFVANIKTEAVANLPEAERAELQPIIDAQPSQKSPLEVMASALAGRTLVKEWTVDDLAPLMEKGLKGRNFERGRKMFGAAACFACHRYDNEGGSFGPDLTGVAGRFNPRDLLESIILPSKEVSDQYAPVVITKKDGTTVTGRIINLHDDTLHVSPNMFDPNELVTVSAKQVKSIEPSKVSPMPEGLIYMLNKDEILDLMAYLLSRGDRNHKMFR